jgi:hypothetical protein
VGGDTCTRSAKAWLLCGGIVLQQVQQLQVDGIEGD